MLVFYVRFKTDDFLLVSTKKKLTKVFCLTTKELEDDRNQNHHNPDQTINKQPTPFMFFIWVGLNVQIEIVSALCVHGCQSLSEIFLNKT